jgi:hypothetical protein
VGAVLAAGAVVLNLAGRTDVGPDLFAGSEFGPHFMSVVPRVEHGWPVTCARREGVSLYDADWHDADRWNVAAGLSWFSLAHLLVNVVICAAGVFVLAAGWQWWRIRRRNSLLQFRVGDLLVATTAAALLLAADARGRRSTGRDRALLVEADRAAGLTLDSASNVQRRARWETTESSLLGRLTGARPQRVAGIDIEGHELRGLVGLSALRALNIRRSVTPDELALVQRFSELEALDLCFVSSDAWQDVGLRRGMPITLPPLPRLRGLNMFGADFEGHGLEHLHDLEILDLSQSRVGDDALAKIGQMSRLEVLSLDHTLITSAGLRHLGPLPKLRVLLVRGCNLDNTAATHLAQLESLQELDLRASSMDIDGAFEVQAALPTCKIQWPTKPTQSRRR